MANALIPCSGCGRHVRATEAACPFCGATVSDEARAKVIPAATSRINRNAMFVFATTLALSGCAASTGPGDAQPADTGVSQDSGVADSGSPVAMYGAPQPTDSGVVTDTGIQDGGGNVALYGAPAPVDAGRDSAMNDDGGGVAPLYGGPVPEDSGIADGGPGLRYGAPPPSFDA